MYEWIVFLIGVVIISLSIWGIIRIIREDPKILLDKTLNSRPKINSMTKVEINSEPVLPKNFKDTSISQQNIELNEKYSKKKNSEKIESETKIVNMTNNVELARKCREIKKDLSALKNELVLQEISNIKKQLALTRNELKEHQKNIQKTKNQDKKSPKPQVKRKRRK